MPGQDVPKEDAFQQSQSVSVLDVASFIHQGWRYFPVKGHTRYRLVSMDSRLAIQATGAGGAGGIIRRVDPLSSGCRHLVWTWRVDAIQASANLTKKARDDVAASIFVLFGDPGFLSSPSRIPTIRYVWTTDAHQPGEVIANPFLPELVKNIVVRTGTVATGRWLTEKRDMARDFKRAYNRDPDSDIGAIAIFTDNDQTREPVKAYYRNIDLLCD